MKAVVVVHSDVYGGAEAYMNRLYGALRGDGVESLLIGSIPGWEATGLDRQSIKLSPKWGGSTVLAGLPQLFAERIRLARGIDGLAPDLFHLQYKREQIGFTSLLAQWAPVVWTEHGRFLGGAKGALLAAAYRRAARDVAVIICVSQEVQADVKRIVGPECRTEVIENSVDTRILRPASDIEKSQARASLGIPGEDPVLLWIGRLHPGKRPVLAVELARQWPGYAIIAGDGELRSQVEALASNIPRALVLGHVRDTSTLYLAADVMAFTSTGAGEGLPTTTIVEAAAHGLPVVGDEGSGVGRVLRDMGTRALPTDASIESWIQELSASACIERSAEVRLWALRHDVQSWVSSHRAIFESIL